MRTDDQRATRVLVSLLTLGVVGQTVVHLVNFWLIHNVRLNVNSEHTPFSATQALVLATAGVGALVAARRGGLAAAPAAVLSGLLLFLAVDEYVVLHERIGVAVTRLLGLSEDWDSVVWPVVYLPLLGTVLVLLLLAARRAPHPQGRLLLVGIACLGAAVLLEIASAPFSTPQTASGVVHALEGAVEEGAELAGWGLIATGLLTWPRRG